MGSTDSVSKGVFLFRKEVKKPASKRKSKTLFEKLFTKQPWYITYKCHWLAIEKALNDLHDKLHHALVNQIITYINSFEEEAIDGTVSSAALLTGVNQMDHSSQFTALIDKIRKEVTPHVAMVGSQDALTLKSLMENVVWQLIDAYDESFEELESEELPVGNKKLKKSQCTMKLLQKWYTAVYKNCSPKKKQKKKPLVIIIPDFESYNSNVLQDFVMITSSYTASLPIVLVFGVATTVSALHKSFPYHVSSKLLIKVFHSLPSNVFMNNMLDTIFLNDANLNVPMQLGGKVLQFLLDVFLFYDFSVIGIVQGIKYCMMEHYYADNIKALCCGRDRIEEALANLNAEDFESIRQLSSFRPYVEAQDCRTRIFLLEDNEFLEKALFKELNKLHDYFFSFKACVRLLHIFVDGLPRNQLGKTISDIYIKCSSEIITNTAAFKECMLLLGFKSRENLVETIKSAIKELNITLQSNNSFPLHEKQFNKSEISDIKEGFGRGFIKFVKIQLSLFQRQIQNASTEVNALRNSQSDDENELENIHGNRYRLKEKLFQSTRQDKIQSEFEMVRGRLVSYLEEMFTSGLRPPTERPLHELLLLAELPRVKKQIVGAPRGALHTALNNPHAYLLCSCCVLPSADSLSDTLPDVSLAYKLHRECGKHINLFDWLQAFAAVLDPDADSEQRHLDPTIQARFTQAVKALHFLGFIKSSKRKTDHVMRLTW